jgi:hypothetical protein
MAYGALEGIGAVFRELAWRTPTVSGGGGGGAAQSTKRSAPRRRDGRFRRRARRALVQLAIRLDPAVREGAPGQSVVQLCFNLVPRRGHIQETASHARSLLALKAKHAVVRSVERAPETAERAQRHG